MNEEQRADARQSGANYTVKLRDLDDFFGIWFQADIYGTYDECLAQVHEYKLWQPNTIFEIVEA